MPARCLPRRPTGAGRARTFTLQGKGVTRWEQTGILRGDFSGRTRREFLWQTGCGFGAAALTSLLGADGFFSHSAAASG